MVAAVSKRLRRPARSAPSHVADQSDTPEREIWSDTFSAKGLINYWLLGALLTLGSLILSTTMRFDQQAWLFLVAALAAAWGSLLIYVAYQKLDVHYVLTNQRLIHRHGILTRHNRRIEVIDIDDVNYRQDIFQRMIGVGTIEIFSSDLSDPVIELPGIDQVHDVAQVIDEARRAERIRRGIHIESG